MSAEAKLTFVRHVRPNAKAHILLPLAGPQRTVCGIAIAGFGWDQNQVEPRAGFVCGNCERMRDYVVGLLKRPA